MKVFPRSVGLVVAISALSATLHAEPASSPKPAAKSSAKEDAAKIKQAIPALTDDLKKVLPSADLAKFLPDAPAKWEVNEKTGDDLPIKKKPGSTARRFYTEKTDPQGEKVGVEIQLSDWGNLSQPLRAQLLIWSSEQEPPDESGFVHGTIVSGFPAEDTWMVEDKTHTLTMIIGGRYLLEITTNGLAQESIVPWLNLIDLKKLSETRP